MPAPKRSDEECQEAADAYLRILATEPKPTYKHVADALDWDWNKAARAVKEAAKRGLLGTKPVLPGFHVTKTTSTPHGDYIQQKPEPDGPFNMPEGHLVKGVSALLDADGRVINQWVKTKEGELDPIWLAEKVREAIEGIEPAQPVVAPDAVNDDLCTVTPLMDLHLGMHAWGRETGDQDYDLNLACQDLRHSFAKVMALTPASKEAVLILGGDTLHADDDRAETPQHKNKLDVDGRQFKVIETAIAILAETIERLLAKHSFVTVRVLRGNHDMHSHMVITFALAERYRNEPRISIDKDPRDLFMKQWGRSAIFAHHGDKGKPDQMALYISDVCPFWSDTRHRHYLVGHVHHDHAKDIGPLRYESLRAFCPPDSYAAGMGYGPRRALQALTFHSRDGLVLRALDPIERPAS